MTQPYGAPPRPAPASQVRFTAHCPACRRPHEWEQRNTTPMTPPVPACPTAEQAA